MRAADVAAIAATLVLGTAVVAAAVRISRRPQPSAVELGRAPVTVLAEATRRRIERLDADVLIAWVRSPRARMPSSMRGLEEGVVGLLRALEAANPARVRVQIVDPTSDPALPGYLAGLGIAPFASRTVAHDGWSETSVWASLRIACGGRGAATIAAVTPQLLPHLQTLIVAHLDQIESPRRPRVALSAPTSYVALRKSLGARADVIECDFDARPVPPADADLLVWIDPARAEATHLRALEDLLARGRSAIVAGSALRAEFTSTGAEPAVRFPKTAFPADVLLRHFGLAPVSGIVFEAPVEPGAEVQARATPLVRSIGAEQDFRALASQPNGTLQFVAPTPFLPDARRLADLDMSATILASSSEASWLRPWQDGSLPLASLAPSPDAPGAERAPRLPLLELLAPSDPLAGRIVFAASSSPFSDEYLRHEAFAHEALLSILVSSLASGERLALQGAAIERPARLPELPLAERIVLRGLVVLLLPLLLVALAFRRGAFGAPRERARGANARLLSRAVAAAVAVFLLARFAPGIALDLTRGGENELARETRNVVEKLHDESEIELVFSPDDRLPPEMRPPVRTARDLARRLASASDRIRLRSVHPEDLVEADAAALASQGVRPARVTSTEDEVTTVRRVFSSIVVRSGDRRLVLDFPDVESFERLEFRLAFALDRARTGRGVRIALAADAPRLSPAEALAGYQRKGLFAPGEGDVYAQARELLAQHDFEIASVDARAPEIPAGSDLLLWLQPRRDARPMLAAAAAHLARGGRAVIAAQHFVVRPRRLQANELALGLWPEPQFPDVDRNYFPEVGIELVREVLFDELQGSANAATRVERASGRMDAGRESSASPLLVRAVPAGFDASSPIVRGLSDLLFASGNRVRFDAQRLARNGIVARPLVRTSERCWSFDWKGGDLPESVLRGPGAEGFLGRQPLVVEFEGRFPPPQIDPELAALATTTGATEAATTPGCLVLLGNSEMFKNDALRLPGYDHAQLLLNCAGIALAPDLAAVLARRPARPGLDWVEPSTRSTWRAVVVLGAPALLLAFGAWSQRRRRLAPVLASD